MSGRVKKSNPRITFTASNYRKKALPYLMRDFECRCAYSLIHIDNAGGERCMEVDHFKPKKKFSRRPHVYSNLMLASRHCNGSKGDEWPSKELRDKGFKFINPCKEQDYGKHIFEDIETGMLIATSNQGWYQIEKCDLNAEHLVKQRLQRTKLRTILEGKKNIFTIPEGQTISDTKEDLITIKVSIEKIKSNCIPYIPPPPVNL